jgi:hypothetical protein
VGLLRHDVVARGAAAITARLASLQADGMAHVVADAVDNEALRQLAAGAGHLPLWVAGSGLALGLPQVLADRGWVTLNAHAADLEAPDRPRRRAGWQLLHRHPGPGGPLDRRRPAGAAHRPAGPGPRGARGG